MCKSCMSKSVESVYVKGFTRFYESVTAVYCECKIYVCIEKAFYLCIIKVFSIVCGFGFICVFRVIWNNVPDSLSYW